MLGWNRSTDSADAGGSPGGKRAARTPLVARQGGARRSFVSSRTAALIGIGVIAVILLALPMREYLRQRSEINSAGDARAEQQAKVDDLQRQVDQWKDPEYVRNQARLRAGMSLPGEVKYRVVRPGGNENPFQAQVPREAPLQGPWYFKLWNSVRAADRQPESVQINPLSPQ
jgi:cell division protein FtsB